VRYLGGWDWGALARAAIVIGTVLRGLWVLVLHPPVDHVYSDMKFYVDTAMGLARMDPLERFDAFYPPGTHVLLAIPLWLVGPDRDGLFADAILWAALSALTPYFMWRYARLILPRPAAAITAILCAVWPLHILYAGYFSSETPGLAFLVLSLWLAERSFQRRSGRGGLLAGIAGGIAGAMRPAFALNVIAVVIPRVRRFRIHAAPAAALASGATLILALVILHNSAASGRLTGVSENSGLTFFLGHCDVHIVRTGHPDGINFLFGTPVATQLGRGNDVTFPDQQIWDQDFFNALGIGCIANDGLAHARVLIRDVFDMGLSTVPWPLVNDPGVKDIANLTNVAYTSALPFIVVGTIRKIRRGWRTGGGRGELMLLGQLGLALVTAVVYFGDPRFRTPFDVFGLALAASLIAARIAPAPLGESAPAHPGVRADDAVEQHDERALGGIEPPREVDPHDARPAEADGDASIGADDGAPEEARWGETRRAWADDELGLIGSVVHEVPTVGPDAVEPEASNDLEAPLRAQVLPVGTDAPDTWVRDEDAAGIAGRDGQSGQEENTTAVEER
jgi:hypothetical protein